jgi:hypothetical protein
MLMALECIQKFTETIPITSEPGCKPVGAEFPFPGTPGAKKGGPGPGREGYRDTRA